VAAEGLGEDAVGVGGEGQDQEAAGVEVEAVDHEDGSGFGTGEQAGQVVAVALGGGRGEQAGGLVDDQDVAVAVDHGVGGERLLVPGPGVGPHPLGGPIQGPAQVGHHGLAGGHRAAGLLGPGVVDEDAAEIQQHPGPAARQLGDPGGQHLVEPAPVILGGDDETDGARARYPSPLPAM
jgi:hypothetical protein